MKMLTVTPSVEGRAAVAVVSALCLALAGCGDPADSGGATNGVDTAKVSIAWNSTPDESYLPLPAAVHEVKSQGFKIEARVLSGSDVSVQSLSANQIQFTADSLPPGALSVSQGAPRESGVSRS